jgi:hypothetical protein
MIKYHLGVTRILADHLSLDFYSALEPVAIGTRGTCFSHCGGSQQLFNMLEPRKHITATCR